MSCLDPYFDPYFDPYLTPICFKKNGNKFLIWAYIEAANHMIRHNKKAQQFFQKKKAKTNQIVALKALSCKIAKGCYHVLNKGVPFDEEKLFA